MVLESQFHLALMDETAVKRRVNIICTQFETLRQSRSHFTKINDFLLWPGEVFNQANPQITGESGAYRFILPPGTYYLQIEKAGYRTFFTNIVKFTGHQTIALNFPLLRRPSIPLPISIGKIDKIPLPHLPDFFGTKRVSEITQKSVELPERIEKLLGNPAPVFKYPTPDGEIIDIRYLRGKKTILSTWATWSPLAQIQVPILDRLQREREEDVRVLLLSIQESPGTVETYLHRGGYKIPSIVDQEGTLTELYPILTLPQHFFVDRRGILQDIHTGFLNLDELNKKLEKL